MKILYSNELKGLSTTDLFSVSTILQRPRIDTKRNFLHSFDGMKVTSEEYKAIKTFLDEPNLDVNVWSKGDLVAISCYYSGDNKSVINVKNCGILGKVLDYMSGKVMIQIQTIGNASPHTPSLYARVFCPISSLSKPENPY